ncbi:flavin-binding monooxygenase-like domain protein [Leptospira weilii serovar Topaz str. LT2116]|uniref:Flavin-binding monooxygenase-like domain protein n=1 Tax=Leptospira weilii serovar Topaz str. LT2116 TaxID=1088540 RepID=M3G4C7_9LEPT|nr:flavin-binding monooxygenase-like domain protein [Leptospira weilii serovar Topaz str. LT2116]
MKYNDYLMPPTYADYLMHQKISEYFINYVNHFGLRKHIYFKTPSFTLNIRKVELG